MAITDLTDSLPYWARQGGPGATGGPTGAPQGSGGLPGAGDSASWLQYLSQMYGITPDQAMAMLNGGASPDGNPHGDGPAAPPAPVVAPPRPIMAAQTQPPTVPQSTGDEFPGPQLRPGPPVGAGMLDQSGVQRGPMGVLRTQPGASAPVGAGLLDQSGVARNPAGVLTPGTGPAAPVAAPAPVAGPLASGGAAGTAAASNPRFIGIDAPNASAQNSMLSRGAPQGTALNLAGLFGGGGQNPNIPASNAQPVSAQRPVPGPLASAPMPPTMPDDIRRQRAIQLAAARSGFA